MVVGGVKRPSILCTLKHAWRIDPVGQEVVRRSYREDGNNNEMEKLEHMKGPTHNDNLLLIPVIIIIML